jgi:leucyl aminopeptidase (aminopeptidase T)
VGRKSHDSKSLTVCRRKGGAAKYHMGFMKKVARMPAAERKQILRILKRQKRTRREGKDSSPAKAVTTSSSETSKNSSSSVNKDLENWVLVRGKAESVAEDVKKIGRAAGLSFECETKNCFSLLTKEGIREWRTSGAKELSESTLGDGCAVERC